MQRSQRRPRSLVVLPALVVLLAVAGVTVMVTVSRNLGHTLIGGAVIGACVLGPVSSRYARRKRLPSFRDQTSTLPPSS